jgi:hypothetical protein
LPEAGFHLRGRLRRPSAPPLLISRVSSCIVPLSSVHRCRILVILPHTNTRALRQPCVVPDGVRHVRVA